MRKQVFLDYQLGPTKTGLYSHSKMLEASKFGFKEERDLTIHVKTIKVLLSCAVTTQLICTFVFAYAKTGFFLMMRLYCIF